VSATSLQDVLDGLSNPAITHIRLGDGKTINEIIDTGLDDVKVTISAEGGVATITRGTDQWTIQVDKLRGLLRGR
jgi:hypothetical protein